MTSCATSSTATFSLAADPAHERRDGGLVGQVEAVERLVEQQQLAAGARAPGRSAAAAARRPRARRSAGARSRVAPTSSITSATRCAPSRAARSAAPGSGTPQRAPSSPSRTMSTPRMRGAGVEAAALRQVADAVVRLAGRRAEHRGASRRQREQAEHGLDQRGLAGAVGAEHRDELARGRRSSDRRPLQQRRGRRIARRRVRVDAVGPTSACDAGVRSRHRPVAFASAAASACELARSASPGSWRRPGVSVSVIVVTGMPCLARGVGDALDVGRRVLAVVDADLDLPGRRSAGRSSSCRRRSGRCPR